MTSDAIDLLRTRLVPLFQEDLDTLDRATGVCELLGIPVDGYEVVSSYKVKTVQSDVARIFTLGSYDRIGLFQGTWEKPTQPMRFMDYKGATMIIPTNTEEKPEFWCSGEYIKKVGPKSPFLFKPLAGGNAYVSLLEDKREMLVISISPRKELWIKNLIVGGENHLVYCDESGAKYVPRAGWSEFKAEFLKLNKKTAAQALVILRGTNSGFFAPSATRVQEFYQNNMEFAVICKKLLPASPQARSFWFSALGAVK